MHEVLCLRQVCKTTQSCRLYNVNLSILRGAMHVVLSNHDTQSDALFSLMVGEQAPDSGQLFLDAKRVWSMSHISARRYGLHAVYHKTHLFHHNSIAENMLVLGHERMSLKRVHHRALNAKAQTMLAEFGLRDVSVTMTPFRLSELHCRMIEILRAYAQGAKVILIQNITANYTKDEMARFLRFIDQVRTRGVSIVFFLSRYSSLLEMADHITVFRNGTTVYNLRPGDVSQETIALALSGQIVEKSESLACPPEKNLLLSLKRLHNAHTLQDISFDLFRGEVLGLWDNYMDAGVELVDILCNGGEAEGELLFDDTPYPLRPGSGFPRGKITYIAENTSGSVVFEALSLFDNVTISIPSQVVPPLSLWSASTRKYMFLSALKKIHCLDLMESVGSYPRIPPISTTTRLKILFARCLCSQAKAIAVVDTQANRSPEYNRLLQKLVADVSVIGVSVLMISNDIAMLEGSCNRILMVNGRGEINQREVTL